jgi:FAD/FMN-containing dehydrogenase
MSATVTAVTWPAFDLDEKAVALQELEAQTAALRRLAPSAGCYSNEASTTEPDFQNAFWGSNYERLLQVKRQVDPDDVFWCHPCVGSERWSVVDSVLCKTEAAEQATALDL